MRLITTVFVTLLVIFTSSCGFFRNDRPATEDEATMQPTTLTVTEAARVAAGYVSMVIDKPVDPNPAYARKIGCRTDDALRSVGPPWKVQVYESVRDPAPEQVEAVFQRIGTLVGQGFEAVPWTRPDPEPANDKTYRDGRGYVVFAKAETRPGGENVLTVRATSPCAEDD
ncbi:hypothetical protein M2272_004736 [Mycobacterium frederiksbergense]|uniref:Lipoprotein n=2 Tax=Mycolicibacterium frederiksbergense TaxID=117567 RepID=A0ABT6L776_9MYCO|nr:hypothetical protein [Mycolicibacterium frederiksbergense]